MGFSYNKRITLQEQRGKGLFTFLTALFVGMAIFVPFIFSDNGYFIFYGDFNVQQIPFYKMCHEAIKSGNLGWNIYTDLGSDLITSYSFYLLCSPFFLLTLPFPTDFVPYLMGPLLILKFALAALTAYLFISRFTYDKRTASLCGLLYAFSGFSVYNIFFNHFHEAIIVFPLLLLSMELLITENRRGFFGLMVAVSAVVNYYFFFGMAVFCVIYFFIRIFSGAVKIKFSRFLVLLFEAVIGFAISAFVVLPSIYSLLGNSRISCLQTGWNAILYGKEQIYLNIIQSFFFPPDLPSRPVFFPNADVKWSSLAGWLPLFSMTGVIAFCSEKKKHWLKTAIFTFGFMAFVPVLNSAFYALNENYYARWFYMPILLMCLATAFAIEDRSINYNIGFNRAFIITLAISLVVGLFPNKDANGNLVFGLYSKAGEDSTYLFRFVVTVLTAIASLLILRLLLFALRKNRVAFLRGGIALVCVVSIAFSAFFIATGKQHSFSVNDVMIPQLIEGEVSLPDNSDNYRIDVYDGVDNTGMYLSLPTINAFHSVVSGSIMDFYNYVGVKRDVASRPDTTHPALRDLLSVRFLLNRKDGKSFINDKGNTEMPDYQYYKTVNGYYVYENKNYIPYGFSYDYFVTRSYLTENYKENERENIMLKAIVLEDDDADSFKYLLKNFEEEANTIKSGVFEQSEEQVQETAEASSLFKTNTEETNYKPYTLSLETDEKTLSDDAKHLALTSAENFNFGKNSFTCSVTRKESTLVFFSVPYSEGWSAKVNGNTAKIVKANIGFMAVVVPEGASTIEFSYKTPLLFEGLIITLASLILFIIYLLISFVYKKHREQSFDYPEGDELLKQWKEYEKEDISDIFSGQNGNLLDDIEDFGKIPINIAPDESIKGGFKISTDIFSDTRENDGGQPLDN